MYIECLSRELAVLPHGEIEAFLLAAPGRWNVVSIREPDHPEVALQDARRAHRVVFEDVTTAEGRHGLGPRPAHLKGILNFAEKNKFEPLIVQCWAGRSRSTAVALVVIVKSLWDQGTDGASLVQTAISVLLQIRPVAIPNRLVLQLGLAEFLPPKLVPVLTRELMNEPRIQTNFFAY